MQTAEVTVAFLNPPKPGKKMWSIKDTQGVYFNVFPTDAGRFTAGETYTVQYETNEAGFHTIKFPKGAPQVAPRMPLRAPQKPKEANDDQSADMAAMGCVGRFLGGLGQGGGEYPSALALEHMFRDTRTGWRNAKKEPKDAEAFNDELPDFTQ